MQQNSNNILILDCRIDGNEETKIIFVDSKRNFAGTVGLQFRGRKAACVLQLYVDPAYRLSRIGTMLIKECCRIAKDAGCETLGLLLENGNDGARKFYDKTGFIFAYQYDNGDAAMSLPLTKGKCAKEQL